MVRAERLELSRVTPQEPKSSASTSSATLAQQNDRTLPRFQREPIDFAENNLEIHQKGIGVDEGDRTLDRRSHNPELYQLSYAHHIQTTAGQTPTGTSG